LTRVIDDYLRVGQTMLTRRRVSPSLSAVPK
jgi:hypothetical protein